MKPFFTLPFRKDHLELQQQESGRNSLYDVEGFIYNPGLHGQALHGGIDRYVDYGTELYSPIDGYVMSSYNFSWAYQMDELKHTSKIRSYSDKKLSYGLGYSIQLYCPIRNVFLLFGHLSYVSSAVPYTPPKLVKDERGNDMMSASGFALNKELREKIDKVPRAKKIRKGDYLGDVGLSGLYIGRNIPIEKEVSDKPRKQITRAEDMYTESHLHINIFKRDDNGKKTNPFDPYGIYSTSEDYPTHDTVGKELGDTHIFLTGENGLPLFVDELYM